MSNEVQVSEEEINNTNIMIQNIAASNNMQGVTITWQDAHGIYHEQDASIFFENLNINHGDDEIQLLGGQYVDQIDTDIVDETDNNLHQISDNNNLEQH